MKNYLEWLNNLKKSWEMKDYELLASILHEDVQYFESPFLPPRTKGAVLEEWKISLEKQQDIHVNYDILHEDGDKCFAHWTAAFMRNNAKVELDGVFHFRLNTDNICTYFKMWWVSKDA